VDHEVVGVDKEIPAGDRQQYRCEQRERPSRPPSFTGRMSRRLLGVIPTAAVVLSSPTGTIGVPAARDAR
jgi:hypothetical protein